MPGSKIPVLEIENLTITKDGRGIVLYDDGDNVNLGESWTGISSNAAGSTKYFFPALSSSGWVGVHIVSGSTYGPTGATYYIPLYSNVNTNLSS